MLLLALISSVALAFAEPSYEQAVARWPDQRRPISVVGCKDHPNEFAVMWNGNLSVTTVLFTDADVGLFRDRSDDSLQVSLSMGEKPDFENRYTEDSSTTPALADGYLPIPQIKHEKDGVILLQEAFASSEQGGGTAVWDAPVFLRVRFTVQQSGAGSSPIRLWAQMAKNHTNYDLSMRRNVRIDPVAPLYGRKLGKSGRSLLDSRGLVVMFAESGFQFHSELPASLNSIALQESQLDKNICEFSLPRIPGAALELIIPFTPVSQEKMATVQRVQYSQARESVVQFWKNEITNGMQVEVPEEQLNRLWRFTVSMSFIAGDAYPNGDHVLKYVVHGYEEACWPTPNAIILQALMQRGYFREVAAFLEPYRDSSRRQPVPNSGSTFSSTLGFISGAREYLAVTWVSDHGAILWAASQYYLLTRDQKFLDRWLPTLIEGLEWIAREREHTRKAALLWPDATSWRGARGAGLMPAGRSTDAERQGNFVWSDAWSYRGLAAVCQVLEDIHHKDALRWAEEREDYRATFNRVFRDLVQETVRWKDSSGTWIPFVPWELGQTNADNLHAFYLDTGPLFLGIAELLAPGDEIITWTLKWLTNGPDSKGKSPDWSDWNERPSLRFEMSSAEPYFSWNIPLRFLRNEKQMFLDGFYSLAAGAVSRKFLGGVETRDGIQNCPNLNAFLDQQLRNMLVFENGKERGIDLLRNSPSAWLGSGKQIRVERAETYFGRLSFYLSSHGENVEAEIESPSRGRVEWIRLHLSHPEGKPIRDVSVNGEVVAPLSSDILEIKDPSGTLKVVARF